MKVVAIVEARMTSSRLPGKHLLEANGKPMLRHLVDRLKRVSSIDDIVLATTTNDTDDILVDFANSVDIGVFRGSEEDVMARVVGAAEAFNADVICEVTGDCPIIDPELVEQVVETFNKNYKNNIVYVNNGQSGIPGGMSAQVFTTSALKQSLLMTNDPLDHEHVTPHIKRNPDIFPPVYLVAPRTLQYPHLAFTMDEQADYDFLTKIINYFGDENPFFTCSEVIELLREYPSWNDMNSNVQRKGIT